MIAVYCRVSSDDQKTDSQVLELQNWLDRHGYTADQVRWYQDVESGATLARPEFDRLQSDIFHGVVNTVVVWKLDRLSRRQRDGVNLIHDWCDKRLRIVVTTVEVDLSGDIGKMIASLMFSLAEIELKDRAMRQRAGINARKKKDAENKERPGYRIAYRGRAAGSTKGKPERARELHAKGLTVQEIAVSMNTSVRTVWRYLKV